MYFILKCVCVWGGGCVFVPVPVSVVTQGGHKKMVWDLLKLELP